jgi:hypothetical protein
MHLPTTGPERSILAPDLPVGTAGSGTHRQHRQLVSCLLTCRIAMSQIVHDFEHGGLTNDYLVASGHNLALLYNDHTPLENHHAAAAFRLLRCPELNFLAALSAAEQARFRKLVIDLVLATDMKQHFAILSQFATVHRLSAPGMSSPSSRSTDASHRCAPPWAVLPLWPLRWLQACCSPLRAGWTFSNVRPTAAHQWPFRHILRSGSMTDVSLAADCASALQLALLTVKDEGTRGL